MSRTSGDKGPLEQNTDTTRPAAPFSNADGDATNAGKSRADGALVRIALRFTAWAERWFPDAFIFVAIAVVVVAAGALANGAPVSAVTKAFGDGFWSLIPFTMQMAFVTIGGYVVATSPPAQRLIDQLALVPRTGRSAVGFIAAVSMISSLLSWGLSLIFGGLVARAMARRTDKTCFFIFYYEHRNLFQQVLHPVAIHEMFIKIIPPDKINYFGWDAAGNEQSAGGFHF